MAETANQKVKNHIYICKKLIRTFDIMPKYIWGSCHCIFNKLIQDKNYLSNYELMNKIASGELSTCPSHGQMNNQSTKNI